MYLIDDLDKLQGMRAAGMLTDDEFALAKAKVLNEYEPPLRSGAKDYLPTKGFIVASIVFAVLNILILATVVVWKSVSMVFVLAITIGIGGVLMMAAFIYRTWIQKYRNGRFEDDLNRVLLLEEIGKLKNNK